MATIPHVDFGVGPRSEIGFKAAGIISHGFITIWKPKMAPTFKRWSPLCM